MKAVWNICKFVTNRYKKGSILNIVFILHHAIMNNGAKSHDRKLYLTEIGYGSYRRHSGRLPQSTLWCMGLHSHSHCTPCYPPAQIGTSTWRCHHLSTGVDMFDSTTIGNGWYQCKVWSAVWYSSNTFRQWEKHKTGKWRLLHYFRCSFYNYQKLFTRCIKIAKHFLFARNVFQTDIY